MFEPDVPFCFHAHDFHVCISGCLHVVFVACGHISDVQALKHRAKFSVSANSASHTLSACAAILHKTLGVLAEIFPQTDWDTVVCCRNGDLAMRRERNAAASSTTRILTLCQDASCAWVECSSGGHSRTLPHGGQCVLGAVRETSGQLLSFSSQLWHELRSTSCPRWSVDFSFWVPGREQWRREGHANLGSARFLGPRLEAGGTLVWKQGPYGLYKGTCGKFRRKRRRLETEKPRRHHEHVATGA